MENQKAKFLIYGAYGYTGKLITKLAVDKGYRPILGGRNSERLRELAREYKLPFSVLDLKNSQTLTEALASVDLVLNLAGPFSATAETMVNACLKNKVHYLDITGEIEVFEWVAKQDAKAKEAEIVLMPGVGFDIVPSDCLAAYLKNKMPNASHLALAIKTGDRLSRGTTLTIIEIIQKGGRIRENGKLKKVPLGHKTRKITLQREENICVSIPWGDVSTAYYSTKIPNITVYTPVNKNKMGMLYFAKYFGGLLGLSPIQSLLKSQVERLFTGPSQDYRERTTCYLWGEVKNAEGQTFTARLETSEGYKLTAETALRSAIRVLNEKVEPGFKTPSLAFGADYILEFQGSKREELSDSERSEPDAGDRSCTCLEVGVRLAKVFGLLK
ncbi:MAG: trans-acting enoyl reductase family protein [Spirulina sp.]